MSASDLFPTEIEGLPEARRAEVVELADGDEFHLRVAPVAKRLGSAEVRMLAYNGSIPGPILKVKEGSEVVVDVENQGDLGPRSTGTACGSTTATTGRTRRRRRSRSAAASRPAAGSRTRASTGTTRTSVRTTARRWGCTATSWLSRPTLATGPPFTGSWR